MDKILDEASGNGHLCKAKKLASIQKLCFGKGVASFQDGKRSLGIQSYSQLMIRVYNLLSRVFGFHYHSQKVIGSLGDGTFLLVLEKILKLMVSKFGISFSGGPKTPTFSGANCDGKKTNG